EQYGHGLWSRAVASVGVRTPGWSHSKFARRAVQREKIYLWADRARSQSPGTSLKEAGSAIRQLGGSFMRAVPADAGCTPGGTEDRSSLRPPGLDFPATMAFICGQRFADLGSCDGERYSKPSACGFEECRCT